MSGRGDFAVSWEKELLFREEGPFFHIYSSALEDGILFQDDAERNLAVLNIAVAAEDARVDVLAYVLMSNHFHFVLKGKEAACLDFFSGLKHRLAVYYSRHGRAGLLRAVRCGVTPIDSVRQFRDEMAYVLRNPFVIRRDVHPLTYMWGSGVLYFNPWLPSFRTEPVCSMRSHALRAFAKARTPRIPEGLQMVDGRIFPASFVNYRLVENLFENARQFVLWMFKNVEAYVEVALRTGETPSLSDEELYPVSLRLCRELSGQSRVAGLTEVQKMQLARRLKYDYYASNGQIARLGYDTGTGRG